ncbi:peptidase M61 [Sphingomonas sp. DT-51]|uniref:M61 family metallopeptidase n=1 Tax=Sphingomonas sp. DT-51 TaxID=3396165 RepID=UPI003F1A1DAD
MATQSYPLGLLAFALAISSTTAAAQSARGPVYAARPASVPAPVDRAFDGRVDLRVDATDVDHKIFTVRQLIPVAPGTAATLLYPRWEAASHGPSLTVTDLAGLTIRAAGKTLRWQRDALDPHAFHLDVPAGVRSIEVGFQMVAGSDLLTADIVKVPWQRLILYPAGWYARNIAVAATLTLPPGLKASTSLATKRVHGATTGFAATSLETLLDAPVLAGRYVSNLPLTPAGSGAVTLDLVALRSGDLAVPRERLDELKRLIVQTRAVFGPAPFRHYDILARLSDDGSAGGTEHRASSENELASTHFRDWPGQILSRDLIAHEIVHAWNGFCRTPADLWAPTPNVPVSGSLLWMYEGQTEFWGRILATRAGQFTPAELRDRLAIDAADVAARPGRAWRSLSDDVNYPSFMLRQAVPWRDWQRRRDYYAEGVMLWLAMDGELRKRSGGVRGIDDFAFRFFAGATPDAATRTYTFDDLCRTLNDVAPADWSTLLNTWIDAHEELDTTTGLTHHGWRLVFTDTPTAAFRAAEEEAGISDLSYSIGLGATTSGAVRSVAWNGPAFRAGLRPGMKILAVNDERYTGERLLSGVRSASSRRVVLTVEQDGRRSDRTIHYAGTLSYPRLERIEGVPDTLATLLAPR